MIDAALTLYLAFAVLAFCVVATIAVVLVAMGSRR